MIKNNTNERETVFLILNDYFKNNTNLKNLLNKYITLSYQKQKDKDFIFNIVKGVVREKGKIDFFIQSFSKIKFENIENSVLNLLRSAVFQLVFTERIPAYSILNESVEIAKNKISLRSSGFVNAVLRKIAALDDPQKFFDENVLKIKNKAEMLSIKYSFPKWIVDYWMKSFNFLKTEKILESLNKKPNSFFFINKIKIKTENLKEKLKTQHFFNDIDFLFENESFKKNEKISDILKTDLFEKGYIYLQDLSSQIALRYFLKPSENEFILDACAAPGGKMISAASFMNNTGCILGLEADSERLKMLRENIMKYGIKNAVTLEADASEDFIEKIKEKKIKLGGRTEIDFSSGKEIFDKILLDLPCSALGTISKNPDAKYNKKFEDLIKIKERSLKIMLNCSDYLKVGGIIVFYTCTISVIENNDLINEFLKIKNGSFKLLKPSFKTILDSTENISIDIKDIEEDYFLEIMPYHFGSEGAFMCSIQKQRAY